MTVDPKGRGESVPQDPKLHGIGIGRKLASVIDDQDALAGFSRVSVAMVLTDPRADDNPIVYVNSAFERTSGYERSAVIGRNCRFLQGEETDKATVDKLRMAIEMREDASVDILNYRADGTPFTNRLIIAPITDSSDEVIYFLGIQKELYEHERGREEVADLLDQIRHRVAGDLSMVLESIGQPTAQDDFDFDSLNRRLECLQLVYESMRLSDAQGGVRGGHEGAIDLGSLLSRVAVAVAHEECRPGIRFTQAIEPMDVNLQSAVRISLLVSEVLANAFAHAFDRMDEGLVELRMSKLAAGGLRVTVTDDGVGLPKNAPFPDADTVGGRLVQTLTDGLDATLTPVRGAAGTVVMIDVPVGVADL